MLSAQWYACLWHSLTPHCVQLMCVGIHTGAFGIAYSNGGPVSAIWGWIVVCTMTMFVGLAMAEIVSALPSSGGPYFWASVLGGARWGPFAAFISGQSPPSNPLKPPPPN